MPIPAPLPLATYVCRCDWVDATDHDQLLRCATNIDALADTITVAATWGECVYDGHVCPADYYAFARAHGFDTELAAGRALMALTDLYEAGVTDAAPVLLAAT